MKTEELKSCVKDIGLSTLLGIIIIPFLMYDNYKMSGLRIKTVSIIPRNRRGKIRFLEKQYAMAARIEHERRTNAFFWAEPITSGYLSADAFEDIASKETRIVQKLALLYRKVGEDEKAGNLEEDLKKRFKKRQES